VVLEFMRRVPRPHAMGTRAARLGLSELCVAVACDAGAPAAPVSNSLMINRPRVMIDRKGDAKVVVEEARGKVLAIRRFKARASL